MKIYILYIILVSIQAIVFKFLDEKNEKKYCNNNLYLSRYKKAFLILSCLELIILAGIRGYNIGADCETYLNALRHYRSLPHDKILNAKLIYPYDFEWGYFLFTKICAWIGLSETVFLFVIAIILYVPIFKYIYKESHCPFLSIFIYFSFGYFSYSLGIFRQMIAINIMIYATRYILEKKIVKYIIFLVFAMSFHFTAIIMLPLYWLCRLDLRKHILKIYMVQVMLFIFGRKLILGILKLFPQYSSYIYSKYDTSGGNYTHLILLNVILLGLLLMYKNVSIIKDREKLIFAQIIFSIFLQVIGYQMGIFGRLVNYYSIFLLTIIPNTIGALFKGKSLIIINTLLLVFLMLMFYFQFYNNYYVCPYHFYWE